jgi:hypothetical protein
MLFKFLAIYALACMTWMTLYIMRRFDTIQKNTRRPEYPYAYFMVGVVSTVLISPAVVPVILYMIVTNVVREIRKIKV